MAKLIVKKGDPPVTIQEGVYYKNPTIGDKRSDLRDVLSVIVANKMSPKDVPSTLGQIAFALGDTDKTGAIKDPAIYDKAKAVLNKALIYNQRPDAQKISPKERIETFFDLHKEDKDIGDVIRPIRAIGYGVGANYTDSPLAGLGRFPLTPNEIVPATALANNLQNRVADKAEAAKKIMLRVRK